MMNSSAFRKRNEESASPYMRLKTINKEVFCLIHRNAQHARTATKKTKICSKQRKAKCLFTHKVVEQRCLEESLGFKGVAVLDGELESRFRYLA
jgi:hypothetical protein